MKPEELRQRLHGVCVISITPFKEDGTLDEAGYEKNLNFIMDGGLNASNATIVVGGSTGECGAMTTAGRKALLDCAEYYLKLENFDCRNQVMEYHLIGME